MNPKYYLLSAAMLVAGLIIGVWYGANYGLPRGLESSANGNNRPRIVCPSGSHLVQSQGGWACVSNGNGGVSPQFPPNPETH
jgi:hypothetical protein